MPSWRQSKSKPPAHRRSKRPSDAEIERMDRVGEPVRTTGGKVIETVIDANGMINKVVYNGVGKVISFRRATIDRIPVGGKVFSKITDVQETLNTGLFNTATSVQNRVRKRNKEYLG